MAQYHIVSFLYKNDLDSLALALDRIPSEVKEVQATSDMRVRWEKDECDFSNVIQWRMVRVREPLNTLIVGRLIAREGRNGYLSLTFHSLHHDLGWLYWSYVDVILTYLKDKLVIPDVIPSLEDLHQGLHEVPTDGIALVVENDSLFIEVSAKRDAATINAYLSSFSDDWRVADDQIVPGTTALEGYSRGGRYNLHHKNDIEWTVQFAGIGSRGKDICHLRVIPDGSCLQFRSDDEDDFTLAQSLILALICYLAHHKIVEFDALPPVSQTDDITTRLGVTIAIGEQTGVQHTTTSEEKTIESANSLTAQLADNGKNLDYRREITPHRLAPRRTKVRDLTLAGRSEKDIASELAGSKVVNAIDRELDTVRNDKKWLRGKGYLPRKK